jgi:uncharacterized delta-60 repeat protein
VAHNPTGMRAQFTVIIACFIAGGAIAQSAICDLTFNPDDIGFGAGSGFYEPWTEPVSTNGLGNCMVVQADEKVLVGGDWGPSDAWLNKKLVRLNANGRIDQTFITGAGFNDAVHCIQLVAGGKIMVGGSFTTFNGVPCNRICRLNADGTLDPTFNAALGCDATVRDIQPVTGNKYVIGGDFTSAGGAGRNRLARLNFDGINDVTFNVGGSGVVGQVRTLALQTDGRVLVGGAIASYNGVARSNLFRILATGAIDTGYMSAIGSGADGQVNDIAMVGTSHVVAGAFNNMNGVFRSGLCKLTSTGNLIPTYEEPQLTFASIGDFRQVLVLSSGATLEVQVTGWSNNYLVNVKYLVTSHSVSGAADDVLTTSMDGSSAGAIGGFGTFPHMQGCLVAEAPSGDILVLGESSNRGLLRFSASGELDASFNCGYGLLGSSGRYPVPRYHGLAIEPALSDRLWIGCAVQDGNGFSLGAVIRNPDGGAAPGWPPADPPFCYEPFLNMRSNAAGSLALNSYPYTFQIFDATGEYTGVAHSVHSIPRYDTGKNALVWYPDGRLLSGGFEVGSPNPVPQVVSRYLSDGTQDPTFNEPVSATPDESVHAIALATSGRIYIAGTFSAINGTPRSRIARLLDNGTLDLTFDPLGGFNDTVRDILEMPDGTLVCTGDFTTYRGVSAPGICRLNPDATLDATFDVGTGLNGEGWKLLRRDDGLLFVSGRFSQYNGVARGSLVAINNDGSVNTAFDTGIGFRDNFGNVAVVNDFIIQSTGQVVAVGEFTQYQGIGRNRIARIGEPGVARLSARVMLDGPWTGNTMSDGLRLNGLVPLKEPYKALGYPHVTGGNEQTTAGVLAVQGNNAIVDWVVVELRDPATPGVVQHSRSALLQRDGDVVDVDGVSPVSFYGAGGLKHVSILHRNHLGVMTAAALNLGVQPTTVNFSSANTAMYGTNARRNNQGAMTLWSGDVDRDGELKYTGQGNDRDPVLLSVGGSVPTNTASGYLQADVNMDGVVKYTGPNNDRDPILSNVGGSTPTDTRQGQLP